LISRARKTAEPLFCFLAKPFVAARVHPHIVSFLAIPFALAFGFFVWQKNFPIAFVFGFLALLMDAVDGVVARKLKKCSNFGNYIEGVIDKIVDFILIGSFALLFPVATVLALGFSFLASFAKPRVALVIITDNRDWPGIGERGDKGAILLAGTLAATFFPSVFGIPTIQAALLLVAIIACIGAMQRVLYAKELVKEAEEKGTILPYLKKHKK